MQTRILRRACKLACVVAAAAVAAIPVFGESYTWHTWDVTVGGNGYLYAAIETPRPWHEQQAIAEQHGGYLVSIHSDAERGFLTSTFSDRTRCWIGLYQLDGAVEPDEGWRWISGEDVTYTNWASDEPNQSEGRNEDYALMNWEGWGTWNDALGPDDFPAIMEKTPELSTWVLLACSGAFVAAIGRRRKR